MRISANLQKEDCEMKRDEEKSENLKRIGQMQQHKTPETYSHAARIWSEIILQFVDMK